MKSPAHPKPGSQALQDKNVTIHFPESSQSSYMSRSLGTAPMKLFGNTSFCSCRSVTTSLCHLTLMWFFLRQSLTSTQHFVKHYNISDEGGSRWMPMFRVFLVKIGTKICQSCDEYFRQSEFFRYRMRGNL